MDNESLKKEKMPTSVKVMRGILIFRLGMILILFLLIILCINIHVNNSGWSAFSAGVLDGTGIGSDVDPERLGYFFGKCLLPLLFLTVSLISLNKRKKDFLLIALTLDVLISLPNILTMILDVIILVIVIINKNARIYFQKNKSVLMSDDEFQNDDQQKTEEDARNVEV